MRAFTDKRRRAINVLVFVSMAYCAFAIFLYDILEAASRAYVSSEVAHHWALGNVGADVLLVVSMGFAISFGRKASLLVSIWLIVVAFCASLLAAELQYTITGYEFFHGGSLAAEEAQRYQPWVVAGLVSLARILLVYALGCSFGTALSSKRATVAHAKSMQ